MNTQLDQLNAYFAPINLKVFCEQQDLKYNYIRQVLAGKEKFPLTENLYNKICSAIKDFEENQRKIMNE